MYVLLVWLIKANLVKGVQKLATKSAHFSDWAPHY